MSTISWQGYIEAAHRKLEIASYHADRLQELVGNHSASSGSAPPIAVQAHFEGVVVSVMAAVDQVAQAVNSAWQLRLNSGNLVEQVFTTLAERLPEIGDWYRELIGLDLRRLRVRMVHYAYTKTRQERNWIVESAGTDYSGSRELVRYANSAVRYGERLRELVLRIEKEIANHADATTVSR